MVSCDKSAVWTPAALSSQRSPKWRILKLRHPGWAWPRWQQPAPHTGALQPNRQALRGSSSCSGRGPVPENGWVTYEVIHTQTLTKSKGFPFWQGSQDYSGDTGSVMAAVPLNILMNLSTPENEVLWKRQVSVPAALSLAGLWVTGIMIVWVSGCLWLPPAVPTSRHEVAVQFLTSLWVDGVMQAVLPWWPAIQNGSLGLQITVRSRGPCWPVMGMSQKLLLIVLSPWNLGAICYPSITQPLLTDTRTKTLGRQHGQWCIFLTLKHSKLFSNFFLKHSWTF